VTTGVAKTEEGCDMKRIYARLYVIGATLLTLGGISFLSPDAALADDKGEAVRFGIVLFIDAFFDAINNLISNWPF
jgi:hypothetical protein